MQRYHTDKAMSPARTVTVHKCQDISPAPNVAVILGYTSTQPHPPVLGCLHHYHRASPTGGVEGFPLAVFPQT